MRSYADVEVVQVSEPLWAEVSGAEALTVLQLRLRPQSPFWAAKGPTQRVI